MNKPQLETLGKFQPEKQNRLQDQQLPQQKVHKIQRSDRTHLKPSEQLFQPYKHQQQGGQKEQQYKDKKVQHTKQPHQSQVQQLGNNSFWYKKYRNSRRRRSSGLSTNSVV